MPARTTGTATIKHVGFVALEALLIALLVWVATMTLAGATQGASGLAGAADAGRSTAKLTVADGVFAGRTVAHASPGGNGTWVHARCTQSGRIVLGQWSRADAANEVTIFLGPSPNWLSGGAACTAEEGYFGANGRWRVQDTATFSVAP